MKINVWCDSGANIHSARTATLDLDEYFGISDSEWKEMSDDDRYAVVEEWAWNAGLDIGWEYNSKES